MQNAAKARFKESMQDVYLKNLYAIPLSYRSGRKEHGIKIKEKQEGRALIDYFAHKLLKMPQIL